MKLLCIALPLFIAAGASALGAGDINGLAFNNGQANRLTHADYQAVAAEIVKREEGPTATVPDVPTALYAATGPSDTCTVDCHEDFPKAFVCWYYNNTRCFNCAFTSDDQSCLEQCTCRPFPKKIGKKVALPVELPGLEEITDTETTDSANFDTAVTSATSTPTEVVKRDSETELEHVPFFCGTTDLTIECAKVGVVCGSEGIQSDSKVCQKNCVCHNWNSVAPPSILGRPPHHSRNLRRVTSPPVRIVNCGDLELRKDCVDNFSTVCTPEGIASDSSICRERCYC